MLPIDFYSQPRLGVQFTNPLVFDLPEVIASLSKYPAKAIEGYCLNWKVYLDSIKDRSGEDDMTTINLAANQSTIVLNLVLGLTCIQ